jgi:hypothetical protein
MKEILILSYFYPPCTMTAAQRPAGWVKYFNHFGFQPTVITRNWDIQICNQEDQLKTIGEGIIHQKNDSHEVFYLPYKASYRDRLFNSKFTIFKKTSKIFTFINSIGENYSNIFISFKNLYDFAEEIIPTRNFSTLIITGNPFVQFRFGFLLNKKFKIPWIADYRDDWTTSEIIKPRGILSLLINYFQKKSEKKWVGSAFVITSVSDVYTSRISDFVQVSGHTILNGFDELIPIEYNEDASVLTITYNGTLYDTQDLEGFIEVILECINKYKEVITLNVNFPGIAFDPNQYRRLKNLIKGYESFFYVTTRLPKNEVIDIQSKSDVLLMLTHKNIQGIPSSKLFEYLSFQKPIICFPSDKNIVEAILKDTGTGIIANDKKQLFESLCICIDNKINNNYSYFDKCNLNKNKYQIKAQTKILASLLK